MKQVVRHPGFLLLFFMAPLFSFAQSTPRTDEKLEKQLQELVAGFHGTVGIYVHDLENNRMAVWQADTLFPTASVVKVPILIAITDRMRRNELGYHEDMIYKDTINYDHGDDLLASVKDGEHMELGKLMELSLSFSDNTASLMLQGLAGGGTRINALMDSLGFTVTRVNSRTPGREAIRSVYGWGMTSPKEMGRIFEMIAAGKLFSPVWSGRMLRCLGRQYWDENALSQIPPDIFVASKSGSVDQTRNEVLFVNAPHPYVFSIFTKNNEDMSWGPDNEAQVMTRRLSALLWKYFEPKRPFTAAE